MTVTAEHRSFGRFLQTARIEKGIRLEQIAAETRIRRETLIRIENEDYANLPDDVFVKGFVRAFARAVGANPDEAIRMYLSRRKLFDAVSYPEEKSSHQVSKFWLKLPASLIGVGLIVFLSVYASTVFHVKSASETPLPVETQQPVVPPPPLEAPPPVETPAVVTPPVEVISTEAFEPIPEQKAIPVAHKRVLQISAIEGTWLKIIVDEMEPKEYSLKPGDQLELEALKHYNLLIGNAGGVRMRLDDKEILIPGKSGDVVNLRLPEI